MVQASVARNTHVAERGNGLDPVPAGYGPGLSALSSDARAAIGGAQRAVDDAEPDIDDALRICVLLPCRNEATTIGTVVQAFRAALPTAAVFVYDNASTDRTAEHAREAGAIVRLALTPGKGNVVRRMFAEIDADVYVLADGDDTYDVAIAPLLIRELRTQSLDMVVGRRVESAAGGPSFRPGHRAGNRLLTGMVRRLFGSTCQDMLSGYRVFSRRYVKSFPAFSSGFETETEMTVHALDMMMPICEIDTEYRQRPEQSSSNLHTIRDGIRILRCILRLFKEYEPVRFFGSLALLCGLLAGSLATVGGQVLPVRFAGQGAIAFAGLGIVLATAGIILDTVTRSRREMKRIMYLAQPYGPALARVAAYRFGDESAPDPSGRHDDPTAPRPAVTS